MGDCQNPFVTSGKQVTRRNLSSGCQATFFNLESGCVDYFGDPNIQMLLTFGQNMDQGVKPGTGLFEGTDSEANPIVINEVNWDSATVLRVSCTITFESTVALFRYLGPSPLLKTATGEIEKKFTLTDLQACA